MPNVTFEVFVIFMLLLANGVFAMSEFALVTARKSRLQELSHQGSGRARMALELSGHPGRFLSTIQIGITSVGILAGAFGGGAATEVLASRLQDLPIVAPYSRSVALAIVVSIITYFSVVIGELVPKRLALRHPESIAVFMAPLMRLMLTICAPIVNVLAFSSDLVFRLFGKSASEQTLVTEEEITTLIRQGTEAGVFEESEQEMVEAVFDFADKSVRGLMTPRTQIIWLDIHDTVERIAAKVSESGHSRFPVCEGSLDNVLGIAQAKDLFIALLSSQKLDLKTALQPPDFVPRSMTAFQLLDHIKQSSSHIVLIVDEYGGIEGLLTHHDLLEAIAGDMPFGVKASEPKAVQRKDGSWLLDGMLSIDEFKDLFRIETLPGEKKESFQTLGGFLFTQMGRVPAATETFKWNGLRFEIVDMDGKRIDKVLVSQENDTPLKSA